MESMDKDFYEGDPEETQVAASALDREAEAAEAERLQEKEEKEKDRRRKDLIDDELEDIRDLLNSSAVADAYEASPMDRRALFSLKKQMQMDPPEEKYDTRVSNCPFDFVTFDRNFY